MRFWPVIALYLSGCSEKNEPYQASSRPPGTTKMPGIADTAAKRSNGEPSIVETSQHGGVVGSPNVGFYFGCDASSRCFQFELVAGNRFNIEALNT